MLNSRTRFAPTLFERLSDDNPHEPSELNSLRGLSIKQLKDSVARDLENLLNSRRVGDAESCGGFSLVAHSSYTYGLRDFVGKSLANPADRNEICRSLERSIADHEPRLKQVRVGLEADAESVNRLHFIIQAMLVVHPAVEPVSFDALLQPTTLRYSVADSRVPVPQRG